MFHMPMSSPMMTTMFGFCCAEDGDIPATVAAKASAGAAQHGGP